MSKQHRPNIALAIPLLVELVLRAKRDYEIARIRKEVLEGMYRHAMKTGDASLEDLQPKRDRE